MASGQDTILKTDSVYTALYTKLNDDIAELFTDIDTLTVGTGCPVSSNDSTPGYLNGKLVAGDGINFVEGSDGGDETLTISSEVISIAFFNAIAF